MGVTCQAASNPNKSCGAQITFHQSWGSFVARRTNNKQKIKNKNVHFNPPQKQRPTPQPSQGGGPTTPFLPPCRDLCQDFVRWRCHPRTLHDRTEDGEEGVTAWRSRCRSKRENSYFDVFIHTTQCNKMQT